MQAIKPLIIWPTILGASREIQCFLQIRTFGDGQEEHGQGARSDVGRGAKAVHALLLTKPIPALGCCHSVRHEPTAEEACRLSGETKHETCWQADGSIVGCVLRRTDKVGDAR
jgi:hypothetical protein